MLQDGELVQEEPPKASAVFVNPVPAEPATARAAVVVPAPAKSVQPRDNSPVSENELPSYNSVFAN